MTSRTGASWLLSGCLAVGLLAAWPAAPARACGGLFCSAASPVNQAAERIIFSFDKAAEEGHRGGRDPVPGALGEVRLGAAGAGHPEVGVSTSALLDRLQAATNPTYTIQRTWGGPLRRAEPAASGGGARRPAPAARGARTPAAAPTPVSVLAAGSVGPYVYEVIKVDPANSDPAIVAINWLKANGYDVGALGPDVLRPYLRDGLNLLAFKLSQEQDGRIHPAGDADLQQRPPDDPDPPHGGGGQRRHGHPGLGAGPARARCPPTTRRWS